MRKAPRVRADCTYEPRKDGREIRVYDKTVTDWVGGILKAADDKTVTLEETKEDGSTQEKTLSFENIAKAKFIHL